MQTMHCTPITSGCTCRAALSAQCTGSDDAGVRLSKDGMTVVQ